MENIEKQTPEDDTLHEEQKKEEKQSSTSKNTETFHTKGKDLKKLIKKILREGNVQRIIIKNSEGKTLAEFPLTIGVAGILLAPVLVTVGAIAALATESTVVIERRG